MRKTLILLAALAGLLLAAWLGGETLLSRRASQFIAADPALDAARVAPLRDARRIGVGLTDLTVQTAAGPAALPALDLWARPERLNRFHASLPGRMSLPIAGRLQEVTASAATLSLQLSPLHSMSATRATIDSGPVTIGGRPALARVDIEADMVGLGHGAPLHAGAAYQVDLSMAGLMPDAFVAGGVSDGVPAGLAQPVGAEGTMRVYLDRAVHPGGDPVTLQGLQTTGLELSLGDLKARLWGQVAADDQGFAAGTVYLYSSDTRAFLDLAAQAGIMPRGFVPLANTILGNLSTGETATQGDETGRPPATTAPKAPPPRKGEIRLPITMQAGRMAVGGMPVGPAPLLSPPV